MENYWCENRKYNPNCEFCNSKGDLQLEEEGEYNCPDNHVVDLKHMGTVVAGKFGLKMSSSEIKKDRRKRSSNHFQKEIAPGLDPKSIEGKHFRKKYSKK